MNLNPKQKALVAFEGQVNQAEAFVKDYFRDLVKLGGPMAVFAHLNFLSIKEKDPVLLSGGVVRFLKLLSFITTVKLMTANNGELFEELMSIEKEEEDTK